METGRLHFAGAMQHRIIRQVAEIDPMRLPHGGRLLGDGLPRRFAPRNDMEEASPDFVVWEYGLPRRPSGLLAMTYKGIVSNDVIARRRTAPTWQSGPRHMTVAYWDG